jgi:hypothetical protein
MKGGWSLTEVGEVEKCTKKNVNEVATRKRGLTGIAVSKRKKYPRQVSIQVPHRMQAVLLAALWHAKMKHARG